MDFLILDSAFNWILFFGLGGVIFLQLSFGIGRLLRPANQTSVESRSSYECGEASISTAHQVGFSVRFYLIALAFILFELEIIFLFVWATVLTDTYNTWADLRVLLMEAFTFVFLLTLGLVYLWHKGFLSWLSLPRGSEKTTQITMHIPESIYQNRLKKC